MPGFWAGYSRLQLTHRVLFLDYVRLGRAKRAQQGSRPRVRELLSLRDTVVEQGGRGRAQAAEACLQALQLALRLVPHPEGLDRQGVRRRGGAVCAIAPELARWLSIWMLTDRHPLQDSLIQAPYCHPPRIRLRLLASRHGRAPRRYGRAGRA